MNCELNKGMVRKLILSMLMLVAAGTATAQQELYIYQHNQAPDTLQLSNISGISHSRIDQQGNRQDDFVMMSIRLTNDQVRQYLLAQLDSVVMQRDGIRIPLTRFVGSMNTKSVSAYKAPRKTSLQADDLMAKTSDVAFFWETGDRIWLEDGRQSKDTLTTHDQDPVAEFFFDGEKLTDDEVTVYYPGLTAASYNTVRVTNTQTQTAPNSTLHIGQAGDCGTAVARKQEDGSYRFNLEHKAAYLAFLPYIGNDLERTQLQKITVRSDSAIAGVFRLTPERIIPQSDTTHTIVLTTQDFTLPQRAQSSSSAYMVIAPQNGSSRLTCEFTVYDTELQSTGVYTKIIDLDKIEPNMVYVVKANCNNYVVDLGLPVKFLNHNMGAFAPEEYGGYYAWGETEDKGSYNNNNTYALYNNESVRKIRLTEYDVAHVRLGGNFSIPTPAEMRMLSDSCTWTRTTFQGINGLIATGKNGNKLFFPCAGYRSGTNLSNSSTDSYKHGYYYTSSKVNSSENKTWILDAYYNSNTLSVESMASPYYGRSIRPVISCGVQMTDGSIVQIMTDSVQWQLGGTTARLYATLNGYAKAKTTSTLEAGFVISETPYPTIADTKVTAVITADGSYHADFTAVEKDHEYYYRAYIKTANDSICYGNSMQFGRILVDLGLPSGNLWSNVNLGAISPDQDGNYYAWAETETKSTYTKANHQWYIDNTYVFPDHLRDINATQYDAAAMTWGEVWMIPNEADIRELQTNCTFTASSLNGMTGYTATSKLNGKSIFLPKSGYRDNDARQYTSQLNMASSAMRNSDCVFIYQIYNGTINDGWNRGDGIPVRPVYKTNTTAANSKPMLVRTLPARAFYDGTMEADTLRGTVRGLDIAGSGNTMGFEWWKKGSDSRSSIAVTPDADGVMKHVLTGLEEGTAYQYAAYIDNGTERFYGETLSLTTVGMVDLGLSVKWANVNIGAESEKAPGDYYLWGGTTPYKNNQQYYYPTLDITPQGGRDAVALQWGTTYRMPTKTEFEELLNTDNCTWTYISRNDSIGWLVTSKITGYTDRSIFMPLTGHYYRSAGNGYDDGRHANYLTDAYYWASTVVDGSYGYALDLASDRHRIVSDRAKTDGNPLRAVQDKADVVSTYGIVRNLKATVETDTLVGYFSHVTDKTVSVGFIVGNNADIEVGQTGVTTYEVGNAVPSGYYRKAVTNLSKGTTYYYRAYCYDGSAYSYGEAKSFELADYVDLDLPSGTLWANVNLGADVAEGFGDYYAWGETATKKVNDRPYFNQANYQYYVDNKWVEIGSDISGTQYDAARAQWSSLWSIPTMEQCIELKDNCTWTQETVNGIACWKVASKTDASKFIYLPKAGRWYNGSSFNDSGSGIYMTSTRQSDCYMRDFYMPSSGAQVGTGNYNWKYYGLSVRPVLNVTDTISGTTTALNIQTTGCDWTIGEATATLRGSLKTTAAVEGLTYGFIVGTIDEVDTNTPADANAIAAANIDDDDNYSVSYNYDGSAKYYRAYAKVDGVYYLGAIKTITAADLLSIEFRADGTAFNGASNTYTVTKVGSPTVSYNNAYKRYEANFSSNGFSGNASNYYYSSFYGADTEFMNKLADGHTLEVLLLTPSSIPNNSESDAFAGYDSGGSGIGIRQKKIYSTFRIGGTYPYNYADVTPETDTYYHIVASWNKETGNFDIYVNGGAPSNTMTDLTGNYGQPGSSRHYYVVGGDISGISNGTVTSNAAWNGNVVFARIYDEPLTQQQVQMLYDNLTK